MSQKSDMSKWKGHVPKTEIISNVQTEAYLFSSARAHTHTNTHTGINYKLQEGSPEIGMVFPKN